MLWATVAIMTAGLALWDCSAFAADGSPAAKATKKIKGLRGRLPPHYADVVTEEQREKIYTIQEEYRPKIEAARAQLNALVKEEQEKISSLLSEEQKKKIEEAQPSGKAKKAEKKTEEQTTGKAPTLEKPAESEPDK